MHLRFDGVHSVRVTRLGGLRLHAYGFWFGVMPGASPA